MNDATVMDDPDAAAPDCDGECESGMDSASKRPDPMPAAGEDWGTLKYCPSNPSGMAFALMPCPYCGGTVAPADEMHYACQSCGKMIRLSRSDLRAFADDVGRKEDLLPVLEMVCGDNVQKALSTLEGIIAGENESVPESLFVCGAVYCYMGEDGKALAAWKKALEMMDTFTCIDSCVCLMGSSIARLILYKEKEFVSFEELRYIDRLGDIIYDCTGDSCKMILYTTILKAYMEMLEAENAGRDSDLLVDIVPRLFQRVVEYNRNCTLLVMRIDEFLKTMHYSEDTYREDDNQEWHLFYLVKVYLEAYMADMTPEDLDRISQHWNDGNMKVLAEKFDPIMSCSRNPSLINKLKLAKASADGECSEIASAVNDYVKTYLLIDANQPDRAAPQ